MKLAVGFQEASLYAEAFALAKDLKLTLDNEAPNQLLLSRDSLSLKVAPFSPIAAHFDYAFWKKRHAAGKNQGLIKACQPKPGLYILDTTAGWGRDAAILSCFGAQVLMLERNPIVHALLKDALHRQDSTSQKSMQLSLIKTEALAYLEALVPEHYPDIIYIDPMHPLRQKAALVKKDLQVFQQFIGTDEDIVSVIQAAMTKALIRVVVKWPQKLPALIKPHHAVPGKTIRFDVYTQSTSK